MRQNQNIFLVASLAGDYGGVTAAVAAGWGVYTMHGVGGGLSKGSKNAWPRVDGEASAGIKPTRNAEKIALCLILALLALPTLAAEPITGIAKTN